jgi:hypothetical protein
MCVAAARADKGSLQKRGAVISASASACNFAPGMRVISRAVASVSLAS